MSHSTTVHGVGLAHPVAPRQVSANGVLAFFRGFLSATGPAPEASPALLAAREAAQVRALADSVRSTDPGFASDLYAAADRYEQNFESASAAAR